MLLLRLLAVDEADGFLEGWDLGSFGKKVEVFIRRGVVGKGKLEILSERETEIAGQCSERG